MRVMEMLPSAACWRMASSWRDRPARAVQRPTKTVAAAIPVGLLDGGSACFETPPSAAPQHEDFFFVPSKIDLILRSAAGRSPGRASRRTHAGPAAAAAQAAYSGPGRRVLNRRLKVYKIGRAACRERVCQ